MKFLLCLLLTLGMVTTYAKPVEWVARPHLKTQQLWVLQQAIIQMGLPVPTQINLIETGYYTNGRVATVYYESSRGEEVVSIFEPTTKLSIDGGKLYKCVGDVCNCKNENIINPDGSVSVNCTCTSCTMIVNEFLQSAIFF
jgi:hypothetical protein